MAFSNTVPERDWASTAKQEAAEDAHWREIAAEDEYADEEIAKARAFDTYSDEEDGGYASDATFHTSPSWAGDQDDPGPQDQNVELINTFHVYSNSKRGAKWAHRQEAGRIAESDYVHKFHVNTKMMLASMLFYLLDACKPWGLAASDIGIELSKCVKVLPVRVVDVEINRKTNNNKNKKQTQKINVNNNNSGDNVHNINNNNKNNKNTSDSNTTTVIKKQRLVRIGLDTRYELASHMAQIYRALFKSYRCVALEVPADVFPMFHKDKVEYEKYAYIVLNDDFTVPTHDNHYTSEKYYRGKEYRPKTLPEKLDKTTNKKGRPAEEKAPWLRYHFKCLRARPPNDVTTVTKDMIMNQLYIHRYRFIRTDVWFNTKERSGKYFYPVETVMDAIRRRNTHGKVDLRSLSNFRTTVNVGLTRIIQGFDESARFTMPPIVLIFTTCARKWIRMHQLCEHSGKYKFRVAFTYFAYLQALASSLGADVQYWHMHLVDIAVRILVATAYHKGELPRLRHTLLVLKPFRDHMDKYQCLHPMFWEAKTDRMQVRGIDLVELNGNNGNWIENKDDAPPVVTKLEKKIAALRKFKVGSSLNGNNGSWTNTDDVETKVGKLCLKGTICIPHFHKVSKMRSGAAQRIAQKMAKAANQPIKVDATPCSCDRIDHYHLATECVEFVDFNPMKATSKEILQRAEDELVERNEEKKNTFYEVVQSRDFLDWLLNFVLVKFVETYALPSESEPDLVTLLAKLSEKHVAAILEQAAGVAMNEMGAMENKVAVHMKDTYSRSKTMTDLLDNLMLVVSRSHLSLLDFSSLIFSPKDFDPSKDRYEAFFRLPISMVHIPAIVECRNQVQEIVIGLTRNPNGTVEEEKEPEPILPGLEIGLVVEPPHNVEAVVEAPHEPAVENVLDEDLYTVSTETFSDISNDTDNIEDLVSGPEAWLSLLDLNRPPGFWEEPVTNTPGGPDGGDDSSSSSSSSEDGSSSSSDSLHTDSSKTTDIESSIHNMLRRVNKKRKKTAKELLASNTPSMEGFCREYNNYFLMTRQFWDDEREISPKNRRILDNLATYLRRLSVTQRTVEDTMVYYIDALNQMLPKLFEFPEDKPLKRFTNVVAHHYRLGYPKDSCGMISIIDAVLANGGTTNYFDVVKKCGFKCSSNLYSDQMVTLDFILAAMNILQPHATVIFDFGTPTDRFHVFNENEKSVVIFRVSRLDQHIDHVAHATYDSSSRSIISRSRDYTKLSYPQRRIILQSLSHLISPEVLLSLHKKEFFRLDTFFHVDNTRQPCPDIPVRLPPYGNSKPLEPGLPVFESVMDVDRFSKLEYAYVWLYQDLRKKDKSQISQQLLNHGMDGRESLIHRKLIKPLKQAYVEYWKGLPVNQMQESTNEPLPQTSITQRLGGDNVDNSGLFTHKHLAKVYIPLFVDLAQTFSFAAPRDYKANEVITFAGLQNCADKYSITEKVRVNTISMYLNYAQFSNDRLLSHTSSVVNKPKTQTTNVLSSLVGSYIPIRTRLTYEGYFRIRATYCRAPISKRFDHEKFDIMSGREFWKDLGDGFLELDLGGGKKAKKVGYRTVYISTCHVGLMCDDCDYNTGRAVLRQVGMSDRTVELRENQRRNMPSVPMPTIKGEWPDVSWESIKEYVDEPHPKRKLRQREFVKLEESGFQHVKCKPLGKVKLDEWAKPGKLARMFISMGPQAPLAGGPYIDALKYAFEEGDPDIIFIPNISDEKLRLAYQKLGNPLGVRFIFFSDDSCCAIWTSDGLAIFNIDISSCDASHTEIVFQKLLQMVHGHKYKPVMEELVRQCQLPIKIHSTAPGKEKTHTTIRPKKAVLPSGSLATTTINNIGDFSIGHEVRKLYWWFVETHNGKLPNFNQAVLLIKMAAERMGYEVTCEGGLHNRAQIQFLKTSPIDLLEGTNFVNIGTLFRSFGSCRGDLPMYKEGMSLDERAETDLSLFLCGWCMHHDCTMTRALSYRLPTLRKLLSRGVSNLKNIMEEYGRTDPEEVERNAKYVEGSRAPVFLPDDIICARYGFGMDVYMDFCYRLSCLVFFQPFVHECIIKFLHVDYGYPLLTTLDIQTEDY